MTSIFERWKMDVPFIGGPDDEYEKILDENRQQYKDYLNSLTPEELEEYLQMQEQSDIESELSSWYNSHRI